MLNKNIGDIIKQKRIELGYSQEDLAKLMGFKSRSSIFKIEKGIATLTIEQLEKISKILNINFEFFSSKNLLDKAYEFMVIKMIIEKNFFKLKKIQREKLIALANNYFMNTNYEFFEDLITTGQLKNLHNYTLPFNDFSEDKDIVDFCFHYGIIDTEYLNNNIKFENLKNFTTEEINKYIDNYFTGTNEDNDTLTFSQNKNIQELQKEIIDITTKIDNVEIIEDIRDIAQLKLDKSKNSPK